LTRYDFSIRFKVSSLECFTMKGVSMRIVILLLLIPALLLAFKPKEITYYDPLGKKPSGYIEWSKNHPYKPVEKHIVSKSTMGVKDNPVYVIVITPKLVASLMNEQTTFQNDLHTDGFDVSILSWSGGDYRELREELKSQYNSGATHVLMIGDLPLAWFEDPRANAEFPMDFYYMDMTGEWKDKDENGKLDEWPSNESGELSFGRLYASRLSWGDEITLLKNYFKKNHTYRTGGYDTIIPHRALAFIDVFYSGDEGMSQAYSDVTVRHDEDYTTAANFKKDMMDGYEWVHLLSHSSPWGDTFLLAGELPGGGSYISFEPQALNPPCIFFTLEACMVNRYVEQDNIGNWYLFTNDYSLATIGDARTTYAIPYNTIYASLGQGKDIGGAALDFINEYTSQNNTMYMAGMTLLGDPSLKIRSESKCYPRKQTYPVYASTQGIERITNDHFTDGNLEVTVDKNDKIWTVFETARNSRIDIYAANFDNSWHENIIVEDYHYWDANPDCCADDKGGVWFAWQSFKYGDDENFDIVARYFDGTSMKGFTRLTTPLCYDTEPDMAPGKDGKMMLVYKNFINNRAEIFALSYDGAKWDTTPWQLSFEDENTTPKIVSLGNDEYMTIWVKSTDSYSKVVYSKSEGGKWSSTAPISSASGYASMPRVFIRGDKGIVSWIQTKTNGSQYVMYSIWDGTGFSQQKEIIKQAGNYARPYPFVTKAGSYYLAYNVRTDNNWEIAFSGSEDGSTWDSPQVIEASPSQDLEPQIVQTGSVIKILWYSDRESNSFDLYAADITESRFRSNKGFARIPDKLEMRVYPNPIRKDIGFHFNRDIKGMVEISLYDINGRRVKSSAINLDGSFIKQDASSLQSGVYFYKIKSGKEEFKGSLLKID
jgi:hypothetical protein